MEEKKNEVGFLQRRKRTIAAFVLFLAAMGVCTLVAKSVYAYSLPIVSVGNIGSKYIEHTVEAEGIVTAGGEMPVTYLSGLRVLSVPVRVGDRVEEGDILFTIDLEDLGEKIEEKKQAIAELNVRIAAMEQNEELARQKKELEQARAREDYDRTAQIQDDLVGRAAEAYASLEDDLAPEEGTEGGGLTDADKDALQSAAYGEADAKIQREETMREAGRRIEDSTLPDNADSSLQVSYMERSGLQEELDILNQVVNDGGVITAELSGVITDIAVNVGGRTTDTYVMLISDESLPCQLKVPISQEQKKYISLDDEVSVSLEGGREQKLHVDYLAESRTGAGYEILINLPEGVGVPGASGKITCTQKGEKQYCCLPASAVYEDKTNVFVYVAKSREGILGQEYYVEQLSVRIRDRNDSWVALDAEALDGDSKVILGATKEYKKGDTVRLEMEEE